MDNNRTFTCKYYKNKIQFKVLQVPDKKEDFESFIFQDPIKI